MRRVFVVAAALCVLAAGARAHELRPAYLELRQQGPDVYDVLWKVPGRADGMRLALYVQFPADCRDLTERRGVLVNNAYAERWRVQRAGGLDGCTITIDGLSATFTDALVRIERLDGTSQVTRLTSSSTSFVVERAPQRRQIAATYFKLGVEHILTGVDHLLFVLALIIITKGGWKLVKTVTAFTVSHCATLSLAALGVVHVPQRPVEAVIALSIVFVASEALRLRQGRVGITARAPWVVAFTFGLLHGLGFAGALSEVGLPQSHIPTALLFFSGGVEAGHFAFIGAVLGLVALLRPARRFVPRWAAQVPPYAIGAVATFWLMQRVSLF